MLMELPSKSLEAFLAFAKGCQDTYQIAYSCVSDEDKRLQDLLHALEFTDNKYDMHNEALRLWESRRIRRKHKDIAILYKEVAQYFQSAQGQKFLNDLRQLLGRVMPVDKQILYQYIDACELIKDTEKEIQKIKQKRKNIVQDKVKGSMYDFPFAPQSFVIRGIEYSEDDEKKLREQEQLLEEQKAAAETIKLEVEGWMAAIPMRMQRIIRYKIFEGLTWGEVAVRMGRKATADSVKKEFQRFMAEK